MKGKPRILLFAIIFFLIAGGGIVAGFMSPGNSIVYKSESSETQQTEEQIPTKKIVTHIATPEPLRGVYMSSWVAGTPSIRNRLVNLIEKTELNAVIIDIKDATGKISFLIDNPTINDYKSAEDRISDIREFIEHLHEKNIYVIGRVSVFQDPYLSVQRPDLAVKTKTGEVWKDKKGLSFLDMSQQEVWDYVRIIAEESYAVGFDEINFDYIRFPSDGNMKIVAYNIPEGKTRADVIESFFKYLHENLKEANIVHSADLFGMTTTNTDDLGIGQVLERTLPYFDYVAPMIYPSHYPDGWNGFQKPATKPYEVIFAAVSGGIKRAQAFGHDPKKIRPWLQDFDLGATYTSELIRAEMKGVYDAGLTSWMMWDPSNKYTESAYNLNNYPEITKTE